MPSVNATEGAMPTVDISESIPLVALAIEMDCTIRAGSADAQIKNADAEGVGDGQVSERLFLQHSVN